MRLNYTLSGQGPLVVMLHGLFGDHHNLAKLAQNLSDDYTTLCIDLPNHGQSFWCDVMDYHLITQAISNTIHALGYEHYYLLGHSLGGKVAMAMLQHDPLNIDGIIVLDIAPHAYPHTLHQNEFSALQAVIQQKVTTSSEVRAILQNYIDSPTIINFLLKSFKNQQWRFNVRGLANSYPLLANWQPLAPFSGKIHFLIGQHSNYVTQIMYPSLFSQFPLAKIHLILNSGHWPHVEKPNQVLTLLKKILTTPTCSINC